jgi:glycopeptide antibiotics resistance protein
VAEHFYSNRLTLRQVNYAPSADVGILATGPVITNTCTIMLGSLIYQFSEALTKLNVKNLVDTLSADVFIMHQRIKLALY